MKWLDPTALMLAVLFTIHLLFPPIAVWSGLAAVGPRPEGRIVELLEFELIDGVLRAQTFRLMRSNSQAADDDRAVLVELSAGQLHQAERSRWSIDPRTRQNYYRFVTTAVPADGIADKRFWLVVK